MLSVIAVVCAVVVMTVAIVAVCVGWGIQLEKTLDE